MFPTLDLNGSAGISSNSEQATTGKLPTGISIDLEFAIKGELLGVSQSVNPAK
jgi:hypothetical protein